MLTKNVVVVPYDKKWSDEYEKIKNEIMSFVGDLLVDIEHVGSTSVVGLSAKPIIDIDAVIDGYGVFDKVVKRLGEHGYIYEGDLGVLDRHAFKYTGKNHLMTHHLYVCPKNSAELNRHITFRDYLRAHPDDARAYGEIKVKAAKLFPRDIDAYLDYKGTLIKEIYRKCGLEK